ncbi:minor tail protein [Arthrobacter phage SWEP2]|uniref:Minor tail protein n=1 Tax=Arthrobacter phage SWEP2 TaxID=2945958 RepID=A0A9E7MHS4_9CAUD|nr:minor tail protein [Arthrobacter phage SWEP2]
MTAGIHYTAVLEITKTTIVDEKRDRYDKVEVQASRTVADVARVVVRSSTISGLKEKISAHADLIDGDSE